MDWGDFVKARYKVTNEMRKLFEYTRKKELYYSCEDFGLILERGTAWVFYFETGQKSNSISFELLRTFFLVKYNTELFFKKIELMDTLLKQAIENGKIKPGTTLKKMYGKKCEDGVKRLSPPIEIFLGAPANGIGQRAIIKESYFCEKDKRDLSIFDEEKFPEDLRYVPLMTVYGEEKKVTYEQNKRIEEYMSSKTQELLKKCEKDNNWSEYWIYALYLMYNKTEITGLCSELIKKYYFDMDGAKHTWRHVFSVLQENEHIANKKKYEDENLIYFKNDKVEMSKDNLPIFYIKYNFDVMEKIKEGELDLYDIKREDAVNGRIKLSDLTMLFFGYHLGLGKSENEAFRDTCRELYGCGIDFPFNKVCNIDLPRGPEMKFSGVATDLALKLKKYFEELDRIEAKYEESLKIFRDNYTKLQTKYLNVIAMDFSEIDKLSLDKKSELRSELEKTLNAFLNRNVLRDDK